ncbi:hypothetical protein KIW84_057877 [Lathyrus oleraceus]|uniref:Uncharacterized protein n=1 Tax=Pisum sativum TaxID=3888 RepID=A0A9D5AN88_PEA|nr:hypothetical protein KIW84_057877 [Pisum sativum]
MRHHPKTTIKEEQVLQITSSKEGSFGGVRGRDRRAFIDRGFGRGREVNYVEFNEEEELLLMAHVEIQGAKMEDLWFVDSGYSNHMSGIKKWISDMDEMFKHWVPKRPSIVDAQSEQSDGFKGGGRVRT